MRHFNNSKLVTLVLLCIMAAIWPAAAAAATIAIACKWAYEAGKKDSGNKR